MSSAPINPNVVAQTGQFVAQPIDLVLGQGSPSTALKRKAGTLYYDTVAQAYFGSGGVVNNLGVWIALGGGSAAVDTLTGDSGNAVPVGGNINILGTTQQITTTGGSPSGDDLTIALASPSFVFPSNNIARQISDTSGGINIIQSTNTSDTAGSGAGFDSIVAGAAAGNPYHYFSVTGASEWIIGIDNSDNDTFKISASSALSVNTDLTITTGGVVSVVRDDFNTVRDDSGSAVIITSENTSNTANSSAGFNSIVGGPLAGDAYHYFLVTGGADYTIGLDNSLGTFGICAGSSLGTNDIVTFATTGTSVRQGDFSVADGDLTLSTAGNKINITTGANASIGQATLVGGTVTVNTTAVTASSIIMISRASIGATGAAALGELTVGTVTAGASFVINAVQAADATALQASDVSVINWWIVN